MYVDVEIQDCDGKLCTQDSTFARFEAENATIMGCANGNLTYTGKYIESEITTCKGRALVVLKKQKGAKATLTAITDTLPKTTIEI